jgi:HEAT repeat protein
MSTQTDIQQIRELIKLVLDCPIMNSPAGRQSLLRQLPTSIRNTIRLGVQFNALEEVGSILITTLNHPNGLNIFMEALEFFEQGSFQFQTLRKFIEKLPPAFFSVSYKEKYQTILENYNLFYRNVAAEIKAELSPFDLIYTPNEQEIIRVFIKQQEEFFEKFGDLDNLIWLSMRQGKLGGDNATFKQTALQREIEKLHRLEAFYQPSYSTQPVSQIPTPDESRPLVKLEDFLYEHKRLVLLGTPGAGKSTTLRQLFRRFARYWLEGTIDENLPEDWRYLVPVYVALNRWHNPAQGLMEFLQDYLTNFGVSDLAKRLPGLMQKGQVVLLLDGLNEIPGLRRNRLSGLIEDPRANSISEFVTTNTGQQVACILSCRVRDFPGGPYWRDLHILSLSRLQVESIAKAYYDDLDLASALVDEIYTSQTKEQHRLQLLVAQPFYLRRLLAYYLRYRTLSSNPARLLQFSIEEVLEHEMETGFLSSREEVTELIVCLSSLAFNMARAKVVNIPNKMLAIIWFFNSEPNLIRPGSKLPKLSKEQIELAEKYLEVAQSASLIRESETGFQFYHQLLLEFFGAFYCYRQPFSPQFLAQTNESQFSEIWKIWSGLEIELALRLNSYLDKGPRKTRRNSVIALGYIGESALPYLIRALDDKSIEIISLAAGALGQLGELAGLEPLLQLIERKPRGYRTLLATVAQAIKTIIETNRPHDLTANPPYEIERITQVLSLALQACNGFPISRQAVILALGSLQNSRTLLPLSTAFLDRDTWVRSTAAAAISQAGSAAIPLLIEALSRDKDNQIRSEISLALAAMGEDIIEPLILTLDNTHYGIREAAAEALGLVGALAVEPLLNALKHPEPTVRMAAAMALGYIGDQRAAEELINLLADSNSWVQSAAATALSTCGNQATVSFLLNAMDSPAPWVVQAAAGTLGSIWQHIEPTQTLEETKKEVVNRLVKCLNNKDAAVRRTVVRSLGYLCNPDTVPLLVKLSTDKDLEIRKVAIQALGDIGDKRAVEPLVRCLVKGFNVYLLEFIETIAEYFGITTIETGYEARLEAAEALGKLGDPGALWALENATRYRETDIRRCCIRIIAQLGDHRHRTLLERCLNDHNPTVRIETIRAIVKMAQPWSIQLVLKATTDRSLQVRLEAVESLGRIGNTTHIDYLLKMLENYNADLEMVVTEAIKHIRVRETFKN